MIFFPFGFEGWKWDFIVVVPDHCYLLKCEFHIKDVYKTITYGKDLWIWSANITCDLLIFG